MAVTGNDIERILGEVPPDKCFICKDGCLHRTLGDLHNCLSHMDESTYSHHVTPIKNDFTNWVRDVLGDTELADQMTAAGNSKEAARIVKHRLDWLLKARARDKTPRGQGSQITWIGPTRS